jgi:DHA1 family multidrug resistance protein-like MFS transporter
MTQAFRRLATRWEWLLALFTLASLIETIFWGQMAAFTPLYLPHLGVAPGQVVLWTGIITAVAGALGIPFLPFWGALADRYARQPLIVRSYVAHMLAGIIAVLAGNVWLFLLARAVMSLSLGNSGLMMTTLSEHAPQRRMGLAFAIMNAAGPVGVFVGPLVGGPVVDRWGFPSLILIDVALLFLVIVVLTFGYRDSFRGRNRGPLLQMAAESVRLIWATVRLRALFAALFVLFAGWIMAITFVPLAITTLYRGNRPGSAVGLILGAGGVIAFILSPTLGALADRYGVWRVLILGSVVAVLLWPLPALATNLTALGITYALVNGVTSGVFAISFTALSAAAPSEIRGRVMSFAYLPTNLGTIVGPAIGTLVTRSSVFAVFPATAGLMLIGVVMLVYARRRGVQDEGRTAQDGLDEIGNV